MLKAYANRNVQYDFASSEWADITYRPSLRIEYLLPGDIPFLTPTGHRLRQGLYADSDRHAHTHTHGHESPTRTPTSLPNARVYADAHVGPTATPTPTPTSTPTRTLTAHAHTHINGHAHVDAAADRDAHHGRASRRGARQLRHGVGCQPAQLVSDDQLRRGAGARPAHKRGTHTALRL